MSAIFLGESLINAQRSVFAMWDDNGRKRIAYGANDSRQWCAGNPAALSIRQQATWIKQPPTMAMATQLP